MPPSTHTAPTDEQLEHRYLHHQLKGDQTERYAKVREAILVCAKALRDHTPVCPEQSIAFNHLDVAMFLANGAIGRHE